MSKSKRSGDAKGKSATKKGSDLASENERLTQEVSSMKAELHTTQARLLTLTSKLIETRDKHWKTAHKVQSDTDPLSLAENVVLEIVSDLFVKKQEYDESVEAQVEKLEKRVTAMSLDLARYTVKCQAYESGLKGLLASDNLNSVKDLVYHLMVVAGEAHHSCEANDPVRDPAKLFMIEGITDRVGEDAHRVIDSANRLGLVPPATKLPGDTVVKDMHPDLLLYLMKELNLEKVSGADWRNLACHVGIDQTTIDEWLAANLSNPAGHVFTKWLAACPWATVRLLYRHLMSPSMRCTVLCKRISDFYDVK